MQSQPYSRWVDWKAACFPSSPSTLKVSFSLSAFLCGQSREVEVTQSRSGLPLGGHPSWGCLGCFALGRLKIPFQPWREISADLALLPEQLWLPTPTDVGLAVLWANFFLMG